MRTVGMSAQETHKKPDKAEEEKLSYTGEAPEKEASEKKESAKKE